MPSTLQSQQEGRNTLMTQQWLSMVSSLKGASGLGVIVEQSKYPGALLQRSVARFEGSTMMGNMRKIQQFVDFWGIQHIPMQALSPAMLAYFLWEHSLGVRGKRKSTSSTAMIKAFGFWLIRQRSRTYKRL